MRRIKQLAIIGSTASGKTSLSINLAQKRNAFILSLDSLALYKEMDIVSAKPSIEERQGIQHFGIDLLYPNEIFDVNTFINLYKRVYAQCQEEGKDLIIVGGTSFYLKMLIDGVSLLPDISDNTHTKSLLYLQNLNETYAWLKNLDTIYMSKISQNDSYRIEKVLHIYFQTGLMPTEYFKQNPPLAAISEPLPIYQIIWERENLRQRIALRTKIMVDHGLIDEICTLEKKYTRKPNAMKSIGVKETLAYLDGIYSKDEMIDKISTNTARLAKRQKTFNRSQFQNIINGSLCELKEILQ
jgi:tRNA dimethylallyltransferase